MSTRHMDDGRRLQKLNSLIEHEVATAIREEGELPPSVLVTITAAEVSPDVAHATVHVSVLPEEKQEEVMEQLNRSIYQIQQIINRRLSLKKVPKIFFRRDDSGAHASRIDALIEEDHRRDV